MTAFPGGFQETAASISNRIRTSYTEIFPGCFTCTMLYMVLMYYSIYFDYSTIVEDGDKNSKLLVRVPELLLADIGQY
jgi:hypothetical protein